MRALKSLSLLSILIFLPLLFYIFSLSLQAVQGSQTSVINSSTFTAYPTGPIANAIIISSTLLDEGQPIAITAQVSGGTSPYTYNFIILQYGNPSNIIAFSGPVSNSLTSNSFIWVTNAIGTFVANVIVIDSANVPETTNSTYSIPFSVNAYPVATNLTPSNTSLNSGQYITYNVLISGGTLPIAANLVLAFNSIPIQINGVNALPGTTYNTIVASSDGIITFNSLLITTSNTIGGYVTFNVVAVDSANTPVTFNAVASTVTISPTTPATSTSTTTSSTSSTTTTTSSSTTTIPAITLSLSALPSGAGSIIFSGNTYQNGTISVSQGNYSIVAVPANGFQFLSWQSSSGISLQANANPTNATISSSGSVAALFVPVITFTRAGNYTVGNVFAVNKHARIKIPKSSTLHGIEITFNNNNVQPFAMNVVISNPTNSNFYKVININESYTGIDNYISQVIYNFSVPVSFVQEHGISNGNIRLFKQVGNAFVPLPTTYTGTNGTYYFYSAVSNSLSLYVISYASNSITGTSTPLSLSMPSGYPTYFFAYGGLSGKAGTATGSKFADDWATITNYTKTYKSGAKTQYNMTNIGYNTIPTGTVSGGTKPINVSLVGFAVNGIYANSQVFKTSTSAKTASLTYTVATSNSFVVLLYASGGAAFSATPTTSAPGNTLLRSVTQGGTSAAIIAVNSLAAGSYTASARTAKTSSLSIVAIVIPPYNVIFNDNPTTGTITTAGQTLSNGAMLQILGTNTITANPPTTGNWIFNSWSVSNSLNLSIANTLASSTSLTVMGNGIVTATWNGITKFIETGLPSGATWNVTYASILNSSTTNTIVFSTLPGTYSFTIPVQKINGVAYEPSTASGSLYSGNAITITFKPFSVSISPPSNAVVDAGQYETFTATVYNGISPYTYNILVVNSITPSVIAHNNLVSGSSATTLTYTFQTTSADVSNSPEEANVVVTDSFPATVNSVYSSTFTINPAMTTPSISPTSPATYSPGSTVTFSTSFTGGTPPYTYNWLVVNSITGALLANALYTGVSATSNSFAWTIPSADIGNTVVANVIVTDSASTPVTVNSTKSAVITISSTKTTTFYEAGLPTGTTWSVTYDGNTQTAIAPNSISFVTSPGSYTFLVAPAVYGSNCSVYSPNVTSGTLTAGGTQSISFSISKPTAQDGINMPSGIIGYVPIKLINSQSSATPSPFQQMVSIDSRVFEPLESKNLSNIEFFYANGTIIPSWLESGNSNESNYTIYWLKLSNGIPANTNLTVYMGVASHNTNYMGCIYVGEAPQLSPTYGQYDNGNTIFSYYTNFEGSSLPSNWVMSGSYSVNNGLSISTGSGVFDYYNVPFNAPYAVDTYESGNSLANFEVTDLMSATTSISTYVEIFLDSSLNWVLGSNSGTPFNGTGTTNTYYVHTLEGGSTVSAYENYIYVTSENSVAMQQYIGYFTGSTSGDLYSIKWIRVRAYPPNGIMPYEIIGNAFSPYLKLQNNPVNYGTSDNVLTESNPIIDTLNLLINGNVVATNTMLINYTIPSNEPAGTYNITSIDTNASTFGVSKNDTLKTFVPAYFYNGILWNDVSKLDWKGIVVANPNNGPGTSTDPNYQSWINNVTKNGGLVLGYVYTNYGLRPLSAVEGDISEWYTLYPGISGIFLDEYNSSTSINSIYYGDLYTYIKTNHPSNSIIMANPGTLMPQQAMQKVAGDADIFNIFENSYQNFKGFSLPTYLKQYGSKKFSVIVTNVSQANLPNAETIANESNIDCAYFTDNNSANPYATLPSYFSVFTNNTTNTLHTTQILNIISNTCTISLSTTAINFGNLNPGANIATTNAITDSNTGTANAYMYVYGGNWIYSSNTAISFYVANTVWSNKANTAYSSATRLSNLATNTTILVPASSSNTIYFGLAVPGGAPAGAYTQNIVIANQC